VEEKEMDPEDIKALRAMTPAQRLKRGMEFIEQTRQFKMASIRVHHPGWADEKVKSELRRWVRDGMKPEELYER
jgi:hypothetical protein